MSSIYKGVWANHVVNLVHTKFIWGHANFALYVSSHRYNTVANWNCAIFEMHFNLNWSVQHSKLTLSIVLILASYSYPDLQPSPEFPVTESWATSARQMLQPSLKKLPCAGLKPTSHRANSNFMSKNFLKDTASVNTKIT